MEPIDKNVTGNLLKEDRKHGESDVLFWYCVIRNHCFKVCVIFYFS